MPRSNVEATRALLDQLMGKDRNLTASARLLQRASIHFTSDRICPHFLVAFCPHSLFQHTKSDMGACMRVHDERTRDEFRREEEGVRWWYEERFYRYCQGLIDDIERKMRRQQADAAASSAPAAPSASASASAATPASAPNTSTASATSMLSHLLSTDAEYLELSAQLSTLHTSVQAIAAQIDGLVAAGQHDVVERIRAMKSRMEAQRADKQAAMDARRAALEQQARDSPNTTTVLPSVSITSGPLAKRMLLCEVCGTALVAGDDEARMAAHRAGKQHQGYETIRDWMGEFAARREKRGGPMSEAEAAEVERKVAEKGKAAAAAEREEKNGGGGGGGEYERNGGGSDGWNGRARGGGGGRYEDRNGGGGGGSNRGGIGYDRRGGYSGGGSSSNGYGGDRGDRGRESYDSRRGGGGYDRGSSGGRYDGGGSSSSSSRYEDRRSDDRSHRRRSRSRSPDKSRSRSRSRDRHRRR